MGVTFGTPGAAAGIGSLGMTLTGLTPGQPIILVISYDAYGGVLYFPYDLADSNGMTWTQVTSAEDASDDVRGMQAFIGTGAGGTSTTISATFSNPNVPFTAFAVGLAGASTAAGLAAVDSVATTVYTGVGTTITSPAVWTPASVGSGAIAACRSGANISSSPGSPWTSTVSGHACLSTYPSPPESSLSTSWGTATSQTWVSLGFTVKVYTEQAAGNVGLSLGLAVSAMSQTDYVTGAIELSIIEQIATNSGFAPADMVPWMLPCAINDHPYVMDLSKTRITTMQVRRVSADDSVEPGEQTLSAAGIWPRAQDNFFLGEGQEFMDNRFAFESVYVHSGEFPSVRTRYWKGQGVDPWTEGKLQMHKEYDAIATSSVSMLLCVCGAYLYYTDGTDLYFVENPVGTSSPSFTKVTTTNTDDIVSITSDGSRVWFACGADGVYVTSAGSTSVATAATPAALKGIGGLLAYAAGAGTTNTTNLPSSGTVNYYVSEVDAFGNQTASATVAVTSTGLPINLNWNPDTNASNFNVYRNTGGSDYLIYTGDTPSFVDDGTVAGSVQSHPTSNGTGATAYAATFVLYAKTHLIASTGRDLVEILADQNITFIYQHENPSFVFNCGCEMPSAIIVAGNSGGVASGSAFIGAIQPDSSTQGATLAPPTWATALPYGETINALAYNAGSILLGTSLGVRTGTDANNNGVFSINPVIEDPGPVLCTTAWAQYQWFGWSNFAPAEPWAPTRPTVSGLGRADLSQYTTSGVAAYASDVMGATDGTTTCVVVMAGVPYFVVDDSGAFSLYGPDGKYVASAWIEPGWIRYGTLENKIVVEVDFQHEPLPAGGSVTYEITSEDQVSVSYIGSNAVVGSTTVDTPIPAGLLAGDRFMPIITLTSSTDQLTPTVFLSHITKAMVTTLRQDEVLLALVFKDESAGLGPAGKTFYMECLNEWLYLKGLEGTGIVVTLTMGKVVRTAYIDQVMLEPDDVTAQRDWFQGALTVKLITLSALT